MTLNFVTGGLKVPNDQSNTTAVVQWLRKQGLNVDQKDEQGVTPIFLSLKPGNHDSVDNMAAILELGADPNQVNG